MMRERERRGKRLRLLKKRIIVNNERQNGRREAF